MSGLGSGFPKPQSLWGLGFWACVVYIQGFRSFKTQPAKVYQCQSLMFTKQKASVERALNQLMDIYNDKKDFIGLGFKV